MLCRMAALVDTHAHLCDPAFDADRAEVLERARAAGIAAVLSVSEDLADAEKNLQLAVGCPMIRAAAGLYPSHLDPDQAGQMRAFIIKNKEALAAIGEVGLDYWIVQDEAGREIQRGIFRGFIDLSKELNLPLNVHSRSAGRHAISLLLDASSARVQMHAFDGKVSAAMPGVEAGFYFSIPPSIVRSEQKKKLARRLPLSCLLVETDSPVLGASPRERNEPAQARIAVRAIAELKEITEREVMEAMMENTRHLYGEAFS